MKKGRRGLKALRSKVFWGILAVLTVAGIAFVWPFWQLSGQLEERLTARPTRLYARPTVLRVGEPASPQRLRSELDELGYRRVSGSPEASGEYSWANGTLRVRLRQRPTPAGWRAPGLLEAGFNGTRLTRLALAGGAVKAAAFEPPLVASFLGPDLGERRPVTLEELPDHLTRAVLAAEDAGFFQHAGLSVSGMLRAVWVNLRGGELRQGGSTITQQLVKNIFLTHERTLARKLREVVLAVLIDLRHDKETILAAYLNEIYWGLSGKVNLIGVGAASWAYFGKQPSELDLCESALLAGMIRSPGGYSPSRHPETALARRNWVLERLAELEWADAEELEATRAAPLCYSPQVVFHRRAPYFADFALAEAKRRFGVDEPSTSGHVLLSSLEWGSQREAEEAVGWGLGELEKTYESASRAAGPLEAALVSIDPRSGAVLSWVGGRDYSLSQFDRVSSARRQAGSAFKPVIYATAFERGVAWPAGFVDDRPLEIPVQGSRNWSPSNSDGRYQGWVTVRTAIEQSLNSPTVQVAREADLRHIVKMARGMGVEGRLQPVPALALGAFEVTPLELVTAYATLAAGGVRPTVHALEGVLDADGEPVAPPPLAAPERVVSAATAYLMTSVLQGVLVRGTGKSASLQGLTDPLAGKTGTTNDRRDSWFAGYSPDRATLVWVGYDDNSPTRLSGARAALPVWSRYTWRVRPLGGYPLFPQPPGVVTAVIDPDSGGLASDACPRVLTEVFPPDRVPTRGCDLHGFWRDWEPRRGDQAELERGRRLRWLRKIFSRARRDPRPPG